MKTFAARVVGIGLLSLLTNACQAQPAAPPQGTTGAAQAPAAGKAPEIPAPPPRVAKPDGAAATTPATPPKPQEIPGLKRLIPQSDVWIDSTHHRVVVDGQVCLRQGALEMFACPKGTKEHESIIALNCRAWHVHTALLAVGARPIHPVQFDPEYAPPAGTTVDIDVIWRDAAGKVQRASAQSWVVDNKDKPLTTPWVFGGSRFFRDEATGRESYLAEDGDLICVSNFTTATLDLPIESSADASELIYLANTNAIPPMETPVRLVLRPRLEKKPGAAKPGSADAPKSDAPKSDVKATSAKQP
ncbi:MAG: hypothetical protein KDB14_14130 [Planctomycetales bacterium]|nr:hypothetical protein [Planctomycetales bacterium]